MYLIDTNIFLEILLEQEKADECANFLSNLVQTKNVGIVTSYTLHSIETILCNLERYNVLIAFLEDFTNNDFIRHYQTTPEEELKIVQSLSNLKLDFDDALQYFVAKKFDASLVTYDKHFNKISDLNIVVP